jgi:hypothetical protein
MSKRLLVLLCISVAAGAAPARAASVVPEGNRNLEQPAVPGASALRTKALRTSYEAKYRKVYALLESGRRLQKKIVEAAAAYDIEPVHIAGAIIGEHTYNVDAYDRLQSYYVKAVSYVNAGFTFSFEGEDIGDFVRRPEFGECSAKEGSYDRWSCRETVWNTKFRGQTVEGVTFPDDRFSAVFFQPFYAGQTFGIGQMNPLTALQMSDLVHEVSGLPKLTADDPGAVYQTIMDPDLTLPYVAATLRKSIDAYNSIAGFDISGNPGLTATLYNLGDPEARARALKAANEARVAAGEEPKLPEENYYGWLVNDKLPELRALF